MKPLLIDTSAIVALLDRSEKSHKKTVEIVESIDRQLITCEAVIAESCFLMRHCKGAAQAILSNVKSGIFQCVFKLSAQSEYIINLYRKYDDQQMDFADACLISLATEFESGHILTLDGDFQVYRWGKNRPFSNLLLD